MNDPMSKRVTDREDSALVIPRCGWWWHSAERRGYETPLAAMLAADEASR